MFCHFVFPPVRHFYFPRMEKEDYLLSQQNVPPSLLSLSTDMVNFLRTPIFFSGAKVFNELPVNIASVNNIQAICGLAKHLLL